MQPDENLVDQIEDDPQSWNLYNYVRNNPNKYVDPSGKGPETLWDAFNVGIGVASFVDNVKKGNYLAAAVDAVGVAVDSAATAVPLIPGGAGTIIKGIRGVDKALNVVQSGNKIDNAVDATNVAKKADKVKDANKVKDSETFIVYSIKDSNNKTIYVGRASGKGTPQQVLDRRIGEPHKHKDAGRFVIEDVQKSKGANRGAEDVIYNKERLKAEKENRQLLNIEQPISPRNKKGRQYVEDYVKEMKGKK